MAEPNYRVLLGEDNEDHIYIFQTYLSLVESVSLGTMVVPRLEDALEMTRENNIDIILLDLMLPDSKGLDTFTKYHQSYPDIPVVVITALNDENLGIQAVQQGAQDYLIKGDINSNILSRSILYSLIRHRKDEGLRQLALVDELTQLYNRRGFLSVFQQYLKIARRDDKDLLLLMVDVDGLKVINDNYGHLEGDRAIVDTARVLKKTFRGSDLIGRIGGDEFVVLAVQASDKDVKAIKKRLQANINQYNLTSKDFTLSLSVGITSFDPQEDVVFEDLLVLADEDLYHQKRQKRRNLPGGN
jgi:two-component system cell cycle response regulator